MSEIRIEEASSRRLERWDELIRGAVNGTIFHTRRFLAYHGTRFSETERFLVALDGDNVIAQIAVDLSGTPGRLDLRSPYGASYGGFVFQRYPSFTEAQRIVSAFLGWCERVGVTRATLTPPIAACSSQPLDVATFALLHGGFHSVNRDLSSVVALDPAVSIESAVTSRARSTARAAERAGVTIDTHGDLSDFWSVMEATFERHGTAPSHTLEEFSSLADEFPDEIYCDVAYHDGEPVAGVGYFVINKLVNSSFYLCQRPERRQLNGLTLCVLRGLVRSQEEGYRWFDFGTSSAQMQPRLNIFRFKEQFSRLAQFRETLQWDREAVGS